MRASSSKLTALQTLDLDINSSGDEGGALLVEALQPCTMLQCLPIFSTQVSKQVVELLRLRLPWLHTLQLHWVFDVSGKVIAAMLC